MSIKKNPAGIVRNQRGREAGEKGEKPRYNLGFILCMYIDLNNNNTIIKFI